MYKPDSIKAQLSLVSDSEDGEVEVDIEHPRPLGRSCAKCKELDPAANDQEDILDTVEEKQGANFSGIVQGKKCVRN